MIGQHGAGQGGQISSAGKHEPLATGQRGEDDRDRHGTPARPEPLDAEWSRLIDRATD